MPVWNGERYLREACDSILAQTYTDLELIISDNGSSDGTPAICEEYVRRDPRVRFCRSETNRGAAWNFNHVFSLARGEYFKWAAHDDVCAPELFERCVDVLDTDETVVLVYPRTQIIDEGGNPVADYVRVFRTDSARPHVRFADLLLRSHAAFQVFGVIRSDVLRRTRLIRGFFMSDEVMLASLALLGRFREIPERLFYSRRHAEQSIRLFYTPDAYSAWFDPERASRPALPYWRLMGEYYRAVRESPVSLRSRLRCYLTVLRRAWGYRGFLVRSALYAVGGAVGLSSRPVAAAWRRR